jgi:ABC-type uncharacterized transport system substrate-binding protein
MQFISTYNYMSYKRLAGAVLAIFLALLVIGKTGFAGELRKIRMAYFEGGKYTYHERLKDEFFRQLNAILPDSIEAVFAPEGYRSAEWDKTKSAQMAAELAQVGTIDLVVAFGPWVVNDLLEAGFEKPIVGMHQFAPQFEGLLKKSGKPNAPNLTVHYQKNKLESDLTQLSKFVRLRRLGLLYFPSSIEGDSVFNQAVKIGKKLGFEVVTGSGMNVRGTYAFFNAYGQLDKKVDALYIGPMWGCDIQMINQFLYNTDHDKIPVMTSEDRFLVERGAFLSNNAYGIYSEARFGAYRAAQIILGKKPGDLPTEFSVGETLAINEAAARKSRISIESALHYESIVVPAPPTGDATTLSYAIARVVTINPDESDKKETIEIAVRSASESYSNYFPGKSPDSFNIIGDTKYIKDSLASDTEHSNSAQTLLEQTVTRAFLNYLRTEEELKNEFRIRELIDRNIEVNLCRSKIEKAGDKDFKRLKEERTLATNSIIAAQNRLKVSQILLSSLLNYPIEQELALEGDRFGAEKTNKFYARNIDDLKSFVGRSRIDHDQKSALHELKFRYQQLYELLFASFENLAEASRRNETERITLEQAVTEYDSGNRGVDSLIVTIAQIKATQLSEISGRYALYKTMSDICGEMNWSAFDSGMSFTNRIEKLIVEGE